MIFVKGKCDKGLTYLELMISMAFLAIVLTSVIGMISYSAKLHYANAEKTRMALKAQSAMEIYKANINLDLSSINNLLPSDPNYPHLSNINIAETHIDGNLYRVVVKVHPENNAYPFINQSDTYILISYEYKQ